ncbi:hypothetical protein NL676_015042 [Syzygium grande]|nr:hypothetical protein NL676_015042 [Syzygium grande]
MNSELATSASHHLKKVQLLNLPTLMVIVVLMATVVMAITIHLQAHLQVQLMSTIKSLFTPITTIFTQHLMIMMVVAAASGGGGDPASAGGGWLLQAACLSHGKWLPPTKTTIASWFGGDSGRDHKSVPTVSDEMEW